MDISMWRIVSRYMIVHKAKAPECFVNTQG